MIGCGMAASVRSDKEAQKELENEICNDPFIQQALLNINSLFAWMRWWYSKIFLGNAIHRRVENQRLQRVATSHRRGLRAVMICYKRQRLYTRRVSNSSQAEVR